MVRAITAGVIAVVVALVVAGLGGGRLMSDNPQAAGMIDPAMAGSWAGDAHIVVNWAAEKNLRVRLDVTADGRVSGTVGDATVRNGRLETNRTAIGRALHIKTDWIVRATLEGDVIKAEGIHPESVMIPLNWIDGHFEGGVNTSGSHFGGKDSMWLAARDLRLDRVTARR